MFITTSIYFIMLAIITWSYCGYLLLLLMFDAFNRPSTDATRNTTGNGHNLAILVPCFNEERFIRDKIDNLMALNIAFDSTKIFLLDGLSDDKTFEIMKQMASANPNFNVVQTNVRGKIHQINCGLKLLPQNTDIVVVTDADAIIEPDTLKIMLSAFDNVPDVAVVGANITPKGPFDLENFFWHSQNYLRVLESNVYSASIVVAPCYAFRRGIIAEFPEDCIADDIYISFKANTDGFITKYIENAKGQELRTPKNTFDFLSHKFRKGNAFMIEIFRFFYKLPHMKPWWKTIYMTKLLQLIVIPWVLPYFMLSTISLLLSGQGLRQVAVLGAFVLLAGVTVTSILLGNWERNRLKVKLPSLSTRLIVFIFSNLILILTGLTYPFYRQNSNYNKTYDN